MSTPDTAVRRDYHCVCGAAVFLRNSQCVRCQRALGYVVETGRVESIEPAEVDGQWKVVRADAANPQAAPKASGIDEPLPAVPALRYFRCANLNKPPACNWLVPVPQLEAANALPPEGQEPADTVEAGVPAPVALQCLACSLNRTVPDETQPEQAVNWGRVEFAKRRLVSSLLNLGLPVRSRLTDDPVDGLAFDLLAAAPGGPQVMTGHDNGLITLNLAEADDAYREQVRQQMHEPYRTMLGHLRHEVGHYYWDRLVKDTGWHQPYRELFGDESEDYSAALKRHYEQGAPADWPQHFISAYASMHSWEDWAESWAHYLHMTDGLGTARSFGLDPKSVAVAVDDSGNAVGAPVDPVAGEVSDGDFDRLFEDWLQLTRVLNEMSRSMGQADFYPFVVSPTARAKLRFVHQVITQPAPAMPEPAAAPQAVPAPASAPAPAAEAAAPVATDAPASTAATPVPPSPAPAGDPQDAMA